MDDLKVRDGIIKIYDTAYKPEAWTEAMEACRRMTHARHLMFFTRALHGDINFSADGGSPTLIPYAQVIARYNDMFSDHTGYDDEGSAFSRSAEVGAPVLDTDIWPLEYIRGRPEIHFLKQTLNCFRKMYVNLSDDPLLSAVALFFYDVGYPNVPPGDLSATRVFGPHLAKALDLNRWAQGVRQK